MSNVPQKRTARTLQAGDRFGRLVIHSYTTLPRSDGKRDSAYVCQCDCGAMVTVRGKSLLSGDTSSCGCRQRDVARNLKRSHGALGTPIYKSWRAMIDRCASRNPQIAKNYADRGITVCSEWASDFTAFENWARISGYEPGLELDRINNDKGYAPDNCRWATRATQTRNTRRTRLITAFGETKCIRDWADDARCSVHWDTLYGRLDDGWSPERAIATPSVRGKRDVRR
jgi:hypothetical protein